MKNAQNIKIYKCNMESMDKMSYAIYYFKNIDFYWN